MDIAAFADRYRLATGAEADSKEEINAKFTLFVKDLVATGLPLKMLTVPVVYPAPPPVEVRKWWRTTRTQPPPPPPPTILLDYEDCAWRFCPHAGKIENPFVAWYKHGQCDELGNCWRWRKPHWSVVELCDRYPLLTVSHLVESILSTVETRVMEQEQRATSWAARKVDAEVAVLSLPRVRALQQGLLT